MYDSGPDGSEVLIFHHGTPGSCRPIRTFVDAAQRVGLRFVTASRPGYGDSTRHAGRGVSDAVSDTSALLDAVGADRCFVAGWSGGGPHALACGAWLPDRVAAVLVIAGIASYQVEGLDFLEGMGEDNIVEFGKTLEGESALRPHLEEIRGQMLGAAPAGLLAGMGSLLPAVDQAALTGEPGEELVATFREGLRVGVDGWIDDDMAGVKPWGFTLDEVRVPTFVWQGTEDRMVPFGHGRWLAEQIPGVVARLEEGEGHLSIALGSIDRMLQELVASAGVRF